MPQGAADSLIGVFQNITANKFRQKELDQQTLESIARQHYEEALAKHQEDLTSIDRERLGFEKQKQDREDKLADLKFTSEERLRKKQESQSEAETKKAETSRMHELSQEVNSAITRHQGGELPGVIANTIMDPVVRDRFVGSVQDIRNREYASQKAESDAKVKEQIDEMRRTMVPPGGALMGAQAGPFGMIGGAVSDALEQQMIPQMAQLYSEAAKKLGPPPDEDSWKDYVHPAFRQKVKVDDAKIQHYEKQTQILANKDKRDEHYVKFKDDLAKSTIALRTAQKQNAEASAKFKSTQNLYWKEFKDREVTAKESANVIRNYAAHAQASKADLAPYLQIQREMAAVGRIELGHNMSEKSKLENQKVAQEKIYGRLKAEFAGVKNEIQEVGGGFMKEGRKVPVPVWTTGSRAGQPLSMKPDDVTKVSEMDEYNRYLGLHHDLNKDGEDDPDTIAGRLKSIDEDIKKNTDMAKIGAVPYKSGNLPTINIGGAGPLKPEQIRTLDKSERKNAPKTMGEWFKKHPLKTGP